MKPERRGFWTHLSATVAIALLAMWPVASSAAPAVPRLPENLAPKAKVSASSEFSGAYLAKFAIDGKVPGAASSADLSQAWAVNGPVAAGKGEFTFEWPQPVTVAEIVYYGRTAWQMEENWKDYEVYADGAAQPVARGQFQMVHGAQRIKLAGPTKVQRLQLKFLSSYGGSNPGASEIQVFGESPSEAALRAFAGGVAPIEESPELAAALAEGKLGFRQVLVIQRRPINSTHVYTYHVEGFQAGGGLFVYTVGQPEGSLKQIFAAPEGQILDADVSYDGQEILFSL
ncbi:MAG: discoidin domain-containing protein, partial [Planctomycetota bacterium]|nr:discoidin domain-containing protein [Planctomycetota bacterium]